MSSKPIIAAVSGVLMIAGGCGAVRGPDRPAAITPSSPQAPNTPSAGEDFERLVRGRGSVTFRSHAGKAFRMDSDTELTLYADGSAHMFEWGLSLMGYRGAYHVHADGCVVARFMGFRQPWPVMVVYREGDAWMLRPWDPEEPLVTGNRGGATVPGVPSYWPFRMLTGDEEKEVLDMIRRDVQPPVPEGKDGETGK